MGDGNFLVEFFEAEDGTYPAEDFLNSLDDKVAAKVYGLLGLLEEYGNALRMPYSGHLDDGIFELRARQSSNSVRVLYFFFIDRRVVLTNGFVKKTQKTPTAEIELAKQRRAIYLARMETEEGKI